MSLEDPFFVVKDEVLKALAKTRDLFDRWKEQDSELRSTEEREWSGNELNNALRSIEWDLEDLDDTVAIVEKNPTRFKIDKSELSARKEFIRKTREEVSIMKSKAQAEKKPRRTSLDNVPLGSPKPTVSATKGVKGSSTKYTRLANEDLDDKDMPSGSRLLQEQKRLVASQDDQLDTMAQSVGNLRNMSQTIGTELDEQAVMLDEFGTEIENAESKLDATMRKMAKVLYMSNDRRQWMAIGVLSGAMILIILMLFV